MVQRGFSSPTLHRVAPLHIIFVSLSLSCLIQFCFESAFSVFLLTAVTSSNCFFVRCNVGRFFLLICLVWLLISIQLSFGGKSVKLFQNKTCFIVLKSKQFLVKLVKMYMLIVSRSERRRGKKSRSVVQIMF